MKLAPTAIIATFMNQARTQAYHLTASGVLMSIERETPSAMWGPPEIVAQVASSTESFEQYLTGLVS